MPYYSPASGASRAHVEAIDAVDLPEFSDTGSVRLRIVPSIEQAACKFEIINAKVASGNLGRIYVARTGIGSQSLGVAALQSARPDVGRHAAGSAVTICNSTGFPTSTARRPPGCAIACCSSSKARRSSPLAAAKSRFASRGARRSICAKT